MSPGGNFVVAAQDSDELMKWSESIKQEIVNLSLWWDQPWEVFLFTVEIFSVYLPSSGLPEHLAYEIYEDNRSFSREPALCVCACTPGDWL